MLDPNRPRISEGVWDLTLHAIGMFFGMMRKAHGKEVSLSITLLQQGPLLAQFLGMLIYRGTTPGTIASYYERLGYLAKFMAGPFCTLAVNKEHAAKVVDYMKVGWPGTGLLFSWVAARLA